MPVLTRVGYPDITAYFFCALTPFIFMDEKSKLFSSCYDYMFNRTPSQITLVIIYPAGFQIISKPGDGRSNKAVK